MIYFKLIQNNNIFGIISSINFRIYSEMRDMILGASSIPESQFIEYQGKYYYDTWQQTIPKKFSNKFYIKPITIIQISQEEFNNLYKLLQSKNQISTVEPEFIEQENQILNKDDNSELDLIKKIKIAKIKKENQQRLQQGIDVTLTNNQTEHFSMTTEGLLDLVTMAALATIDDSISTKYSQQDLFLIINKINKFKQECNSYCNSLIQQIKSSTSIKEINDIQYKKEGN